MEGELSCYGGGQFNGGSMLGRGNGCYNINMFNGGGMVMLERWSV